MENKTIAFIGIDGAGKTTIIKKVGKELRKKGITSEVFYMGLGRDIQFPLLKRLMGLYSDTRYKGNVITNQEDKELRKEKVKQGARDNYRIRGFGWLFVQFIEFWTRWFKSRKYRKRNYVLFDRFFYDGLVFAGERNFKIFKRFIPKIDKCFLIYAPSEVIRMRKKEASVGNINEFYNKVKFLSRYFDIEVIDNTKNLNKVVKEIMGRIEDK